MDLWHDVRYAVRRLVEARWFTLAAVAALSLGIGANTTVFTFVNAVLLRGLPFDEPDRIVAVWTENDRAQQMGVSDPVTLVGVVLVMVAVAVLACLWPARRAARIDPMVALRTE